MIILDIIIYMAIGTFLSWIFYFLRRKDLLGGFTMGAVVGIMGAVLGVLILRDIVRTIIVFMQDGFNITNVDVLTALLGGYGALSVYNRINHDRTRQ